MTGVDDFQAAMADACRNYYEATTRPYNTTRVLAVFWEKDEKLGLGDQVRRVRDLFQRSYGYDVELLAIKMQDPNPDVTIAFNLGRLLGGLKEGDLAIFYYIGNGDQGGFQEVRAQIIDPSPADVLILLDCCAAPGKDIGHRKELIAASALDGTTEYSPSRFTDALVQQLQHAIDNRHILSTAQLYNRLATRHLATQYLAIQGQTPQLNAMPYFLQNSGENQAPIMLAPNMAHESWTPGEVLAIFQSPVIVILHVHLRDAHAATMDQVRHWLLKTASTISIGSRSSLCSHLYLRVRLPSSALPWIYGTRSARTLPFHSLALRKMTTVVYTSPRLCQGRYDPFV